MLSDRAADVSLANIDTNRIEYLCLIHRYTLQNFSLKNELFATKT